jgi:hypothetical protein
MSDIELSADERAAHDRDEAIIGAGLATFVEVGRALMRIRDRRSYLLTHRNFGIYIRERWRFNAPYAYNLMLGAEVIDVLEGHAVEVLPANARVAYELRTLVDQPPALVDTWRLALERYGEQPRARDLARLVRDDAEPAKPSTEDDEDDAPKLTHDQRNYAKSIATATAHIEAAKALQRSALGTIDARTARIWARRVKRMRTLAADLQKALDRKT